MEKLPVIYQGKLYIMLYQDSSGFCGIVKQGSPSNHVKVVHFSELQLKK
nr:hypothetical protein [Neobacillus sp. Marseille-Q6967]